MHYRNGRAAKNGDRVILLPSRGYSGDVKTGILYDAKGDSNDCNGRIAQVSQNDPIADLKNCLHADDVNEAAATVHDTTKAV